MGSGVEGGGSGGGGEGDGEVVVEDFEGVGEEDGGGGEVAGDEGRGYCGVVGVGRFVS